MPVGSRGYAINTARRHLRTMAMTAAAADKRHWGRSHSQIIGYTPGGSHGAHMVAMVDEQSFKAAQAGYAPDPAMEGGNSRHIVATCPANIVALISALSKLSEFIPELKEVLSGVGE